MKVSALLCFSILLSSSIHAQENLVRFEELTFSSDVEKKILEEYFVDKKTDLFALFMASGKLLNEPAMEKAKSRFYDHLDQNLNDKTLSKKNDKKVRIIYDDLHKTFLNKYETKNCFEDIFHNGYYNCVSASALYSLAFNHLNIPFVIKEKPTHVYLIAFPENERIMVETTTPVGGYVAMTPQFKQGFIKMLRDQKLISSQEYASQSTDVLFDRYYFGEQANITLPQLLGLQYFNEGLYFFQDQKQIEAMHQLEKAYLFYPSERIAYMLMSATHDAFKHRESKDTIHATCLARLARYKKYGITSDMITGEFNQVISDLLFEKGLTENLKQYFNQLESALQDTSLRNEIRFAYHFENGRLLYNQARFRESITFFEQCLKEKPNHQEANRIFISSVANILKRSSNREAIKALEEYAVNYPVLLNNNIFNEMLGTTYLYEMEMSFKESRSAEAEKYKNTFEVFRKAHPEVNFHSHAVGEAYSAGAVFYFKKGQTSKAKTVLAKGLEISPENYELMARKRMIE
jgi:tetratricopeptide (TPR) repeat protein